MALPDFGVPITLSQLAAEYGITPMTIGGLYGKSGAPVSGPLGMGFFYGKSSAFTHDINSNIANVNLRNLVVSAGWNGTAPVIININAAYANTITIDGLFPGGVQVNISAGTLVGGTSGSGTAIVARTNVTINNLGKIYGGGGNGGAGGFGQAGYRGGSVFTAYGGYGGNGQGFSSAVSYTILSAGGGGPGDYYTYGGATFGDTPPYAYGGAGGNGGNWGVGGGTGSPGGTGGAASPASSGYGSSGGPPGAYVDGSSYVTWLATGDRKGVTF